MREKISPQTEMVLGVLSSSRCHLTAEEILGSLDGIGTATVYRALDHLTELGYVRRLSLGKKKAVYECTRKPHMHFVCDRCGQVYDIEADLSGMIGEAAKCCSHQVTWSEVTAHGICKACRAAEAEAIASTEHPIKLSTN